MAVVNKTSSAVAAVGGRARPKAAVPTEPKRPPARTTPVAAAPEKMAKKALVPGLPEQKKTAGDKRKRLSKAFLRPLDKKLKRSAVVRDCFSFPDVEYAHLVALKKRLLAEGIEIKKSELLRAGLALLVSLDEAELRTLLAKVPRLP
jgi:hypothetical protein